MKRWALGGIVLGTLAALVIFAPASWLAAGVARGSGGMLQLSDARGTVWSGDATVVLTGGSGSRDASALPGRLAWRIRPSGLGLAVHATQACCIAGELTMRMTPAIGGVRIELPPGPGGSPRKLGAWPASWLAGLGTPWNTLQPSGLVQLSSPGLVIESSGGRLRFSGRVDVELNAFASRISTLDVLGDYRLTMSGAPVGSPGAAEAADLQLSTLGGALLLSGSGQWSAKSLRFRGSASAAPGHEAVLNNLLNIIGRRQGALALISIG